MSYSIVSFKERPEIFYKIDEIVPTVWPKFMLTSEVADKWWDKLFEWFPEYQLALIENDEVIGGANCLPLHWEGEFSDLPDEGWDWAIEKGGTDHEKGIKPNVVNGIQIVVRKDRQGEGWSGRIIDAVKQQSVKLGYSNLIIPIRPSLKYNYPLISMDDYVNWTREDGLPFDPWIRIHSRADAKIESVCHKSMDLHGTAQQWKEWTGIEMKQSGDYIIPFALNPVSYDQNSDNGVYIEPNIWISYNSGCPTTHSG